LAAKKEKKIMTGQHAELASKKKEKKVTVGV